MGNERDLLKALSALRQKEEESQAEKFSPNSDAQLEFLNSTAQTVCLFGGNRVGKTTVGSFAVYCHTTGRYPSWWRGQRFAGPITVWVVGVTSQRVRDTLQVKLLGRLGKIGTGMIPKNDICVGSIIRKTQVPMAIDIVEVKNVSGGTSTIQFFSYEMDQEKFMGSSVNLVVFDEEPPKNIYEECKMRILDCSGTMYFTFTPLQGHTPLYEEILENKSIHKIWLSMDDAKHLKKEDIERTLDGMDEETKKARRYGIAAATGGKIFDFEERDYIIEPFEIPSYWRKIGGLDFGVRHPTASVIAAIDDDSETIYITHEYCVEEKSPIHHAAHLKKWGVKFLADPSGFSRSPGSLTSVATMYGDEGLTLIKANNDVDASFVEIRKRIGRGGLYIFSSCTVLLRQMRLYRTKTTADGNAKVVKEEDDLIDAMRYLIMGIEEHADVPNRYKPPLNIEPWKPADGRIY